jgi:putative endonuclease
MSNRRQAVGRWGEQVAATWLEERGYEIIGRNIRTPYGELDLVARRDAHLSLVEVKTRSNRNFGLPEEAVTATKRAHMVAAAEYYAAEGDLESWQIDVIAIEGQPGQVVEIIHFENVA